MRNNDIEAAAKKAVATYEKNRGRTVVNGQGGKGQGFDLMTQSKSETRIIEIKSTNAKYLHNRWLEPLEYQTMIITENYWVYAVLNASTEPSIKPFTREEWVKHFDREEIKRWYKFSRKEFKRTEKP